MKTRGDEFNSKSKIRETLDRVTKGGSKYVIATSRYRRTPLLNTGSLLLLLTINLLIPTRISGEMDDVSKLKGIHQANRQWKPQIEPENWKGSVIKRPGLINYNSKIPVNPKTTTKVRKEAEQKRAERIEDLRTGDQNDKTLSIRHSISLDEMEINLEPEKRLSIWKRSPQADNLTVTENSQQQLKPIKEQPGDDGAKESQRPWTFTVIGVSLVCSATSALAGMIIYRILPRLRLLQGNIITSLLGSIFVAYSLLATIRFQSPYVSDFVCTVEGFLTYYWLLSTFTWLNVMCFNVWQMVTISMEMRSRIVCWPKTDRLLFYLYSAFGWGVPAVFAGIALIADLTPSHGAFADALFFLRLKPKMGHSKCWFHSRKAVWTYFYGPILIIITLNIVFYVSIIRRLRMRTADSATPSAGDATGQISHPSASDIMSAEESAVDRKNRMKTFNRLMRRNRLYVKLFFVMGITFIFEILSDIYDHHLPQIFIIRVIFITMDIINGLQGLILFVILVLTRKKVLHDLLTMLNVPEKYFPQKHHNRSSWDDDEEGEEEFNSSLSGDGHIIVGNIERCRNENNQADGTTQHSGAISAVTNTLNIPKKTTPKTEGEV